MRIIKNTIIFTEYEIEELFIAYKLPGIMVIDKGSWYRVWENIEYKDIVFKLTGITDFFKISDIRWSERGKMKRSINYRDQHNLKAYKIIYNL